MSSYSSSLFIKKNIRHHIWQQLAELCLDLASQDETQLFTEDTLFKLLENEPRKYLTQQLETDEFFLLITPKFNAFLYLEKDILTATYQVSVIFDPTAIIAQLVRFADKQKWSVAAVNLLRSNLTAKLSFNQDYSANFMFKAVKLLINSAEHVDRHHSHYATHPMENLLDYQVEQTKIFEQIKIQIGQNLNVSEIIQTTINRSRDFIESDRLLIYQLGVPLESDQMGIKPVRMVDTVTYEARRSDQVISALYLQEGAYWGKDSRCRQKYRQGHSLVIDDLTASFHLNPCLQPLMNELQIKAKIVIPIKVKSRLWGLLIAHQCEPRSWQHQDIQFLRQIAEYLALAIFNHQSYQQLQQQKQLLEKQVQTQAHQLKDALLAAEAASKSKHDFLGSMSHELRTPLTCVIGLSSTLLQWSSTKEKMRLSPEKP